VAFASARNGPYNIVRRRADGSRSEERLETSETDHIPYAWSRDGRWIVMGRRLLSGRIDLALLGVGAGSTQSPPLQSAPGDRGAALSPDGRFMALASNEAGRMAVFVTRFPATGEKWQVSRASGLGPVWGPEGRELYYREGDDLMVVSLTLTPEFRMSQPRVLFRAPYDEGLPGTENDANYDVSPDGAHFVFLERAANHRVPPSLQVVQNWFEELVHRTSRGSR
jgi:Tol biopolymer transport system component